MDTELAAISAHGAWSPISVGASLWASSMASAAVN
jgi:hypothetical protein